MTSVAAGQLEPHLGGSDAASGLLLHSGGAGLVVGLDQYGEPVAVRFFRPEPTAAVAVGGLRFAQLLAFRALGVGAHVAVHTARPAAWAAFARIRPEPDDAIRLVPPGTRLPGGGSLSRPRLALLDTGPGVSDGELEGDRGAFTTVLSVHDELTAWDVDRLLRADLTFLQPLSTSEATLAASVLGKPELASTLARLPADMATVVGHGVVRWTRLAQTQIEIQTIGPCVRA